jgi:hypothetical protein
MIEVNTASAGHPPRAPTSLAMDQWRRRKANEPAWMPVSALAEALDFSVDEALDVVELAGWEVRPA